MGGGGGRVQAGHVGFDSELLWAEETGIKYGLISPTFGGGIKRERGESKLEVALD